MKYSRPPLPLWVRAQLFTYAGKDDPDQNWGRYRQSRAGTEEALTLKTMAGVRQRCMYCRDSRGCDIEHYWPKAAFPEKAYSWKNHLWICSDCNRTKNNTFPLTSCGDPLILDPTRASIWQHFVYIADTGLIHPRWTSDTDQDPIAVSTLRCIPSLNYESTAEQRRRVAHRFMTALRQTQESGFSFKTQDHANLIYEIKQDDPGLLSWFIFYEGRQSAEMSRLINEHPRTYRRALRAACYWPS